MLASAARSLGRRLNLGVRFIVDDRSVMDARNRDVRLGDWVRIIQAPTSIVGMPPETLDAFSVAIGLTLQVLEIDEVGCLELALHQKLPRWDTIWLESACCVRSRRPKQPGRYFLRHRKFVADAQARRAI